MVWIPGGDFSMGSTIESEALCALPGVTRDALPVHRVHVDGFWMDTTELTNGEFARFVNATGYVTIAERTPTAAEFPGAPFSSLVAGSVVFTPTAAAVPLDNHSQWWRYQHGADWRHPEGPASTIRGREKHPWSTSATTTRWPLRPGRESGCRPKPSGSSPPAAASPASCMPGAMTFVTATGRWPIPTRASFR